jgi:hypothetical protein
MMNNETRQTGGETMSSEVSTAMFHLVGFYGRRAITFPERATVEPVNDPVHVNRVCRVRIPMILGIKECEYVHTILDGDKVYA